MRRLIASIVVTAVLGMTMPGIASASGPGVGKADTASLVSALAAAPDPAIAFASLNPAQQGDVVEYLSGGSIGASTPVVAKAVGVQSGTLAATGGGCWQIDWYVFMNNYLGNRLWTYDQHMEWCSDGTYIRNTPLPLVAYRNAKDVAPFWSYTPLSWQPYGGNGQTYWRIYSNAEFKYCFPVGNCIQYRYPWFDMTVHPNGTVSGSAGG